MAVARLTSWKWAISLSLLASFIPRAKTLPVLVPDIQSSQQQGQGRPEINPSLPISDKVNKSLADPWLYLSLNSLASRGTDELGQEFYIERRIELNWQASAPGPGDQVALFLGHPVDNPEAQQLQTYNIADFSEGTVVTDHQLPRTNLSGNSDWSEKKCLGDYYGVYLKDGVTQDSISCLSSQPTWMQDNGDTLGALPIRNLLIPGTHDSGAYAEYKGAASENIVIKYVITQEETILSQLIHGVRYFDLRIGFYEKEDVHLWLNHGIARVNPFQEAMEGIVEFLEKTNEVIILDFHGFPVGFDDDGTADQRHQELIDYVIGQIGQWMVPRDVGYDVTLNDLWASGKRVIVAYSDDRYTSDPRLWSGVLRQWGDTNDVDELKSFLSNAVQQSYSEWWTAAAELTPTETDVLFDLLDGLRNAAQMVNRPVTSLVRNEWAGSSINIVASDYFMGTGLVPIAIDVNLARAHAHRLLHQ